MKTPLFRCPSFPHKGLFPTSDLPVILLLFALFAQILCSAENASAVSHRYLQQTGSKSQKFVWILKAGRENRLTSENSMDRYVVVMDPSFVTLQWRLDNPAEATAITVRRGGRKRRSASLGLRVHSANPLPPFCTKERRGGHSEDFLGVS